MKCSKFFLEIGVLFFFLLSGCNKNMQTPVYFQIDSVDFAADYTVYGTASHKITDVWVTVNGISLGVYELPAKFPVLAEGRSKIQFSPGIMMDGLTTKRPVYPMYTTCIVSADLLEDSVYTFHPSFTYEDYVKFAFKEDFEDAGFKFTAIDTGAQLQKTGAEDLVFYYPGEINNFSGKVIISKQTGSFFEIITNDAFTLRYSNTRYCFLELNYRMDVAGESASGFEQNVNFFNNTQKNALSEIGDMEVEVGIYANLVTGITKQSPLIKIKPSKSWKKMYINVTETINNQSTFLKDFKVYIKGTSKDGVVATCFFDNIKLVYIPY